MKLAFVAGSNGPDGADRLRFAASDADRVGAALSHRRCGYRLAIDTRPHTASQVREAFQNAAASCRTGDTFVAYFAGHGIIENGELVILWDNTDFANIVGTGVWASDLLRALAFCRASSKLVVLDCCKAGGVVREPGLRDGEQPAEVAFHQVTPPPRECLFLVASDHVQKARELESLGGGFLARKLCDALTSHFHSIPKRDNSRLSLEDFREWVRSEARTHNRYHPEAGVPEPYTFGRSEEPFVLRSHAEMPPVELAWPNDTTMVVLPHRPSHDFAILVSKYPVTNKQYRRFVKRTGHREPTGETLVREGSRNSWKGPFFPWREEAYNDDLQPVVCVDVDDARAYAAFINERLSKRGWLGKRDPANRALSGLPNPAMWMFATFGNMGPLRKAFLDPGVALHEIDHKFHENAQKPAPIDLSGARTNRFGFSDMIGNVWEWVTTPVQHRAYLGTISIREDDEEEEFEVLGGGFLDDIRSIRLRLSARELEHEQHTSHTDLGFRLAGIQRVADLPDDVSEFLMECPMVSDIQRFVEDVFQFSRWR